MKRNATQSAVPTGLTDAEEPATPAINGWATIRLSLRDDSNGTTHGYFDAR